MYARPKILEAMKAFMRADQKERRVIKAGAILYAIFEGREPLPIRPSSETEFFYEGRGETARFELDRTGNVIAMTVRTMDGKEHRAIRER